MNIFLDITKLKDEELWHNREQLTKKFFMSKNPSLQLQLQNYIDAIQEELNRRKEIAENKDVDNLIKIV